MCRDTKVVLHNKINRITINSLSSFIQLSMHSFIHSLNAECYPSCSGYDESGMFAYWSLRAHRLQKSLRAHNRGFSNQQNGKMMGRQALRITENILPSWIFCCLLRFQGASTIIQGRLSPVTS